MKINKGIANQQSKSKQFQGCAQQRQETKQNNLTHQLLKNKFYNPHIQSYYFRNLNDMLFGPYSKNYVQFQQMSYLCKESQYLIKDYDFQQICHSIKRVVLKRTQKDIYAIINFREDHYKLTLNHYLRKKQLNKNKKKTKNIYKSTLSTQQTAQDRNLLQCLESKDKTQQKFSQDPQLDLVSNISQIQLRKLAKKLDIMADSILKIKSKGLTKYKAEQNINDILSPRKRINERQLFFKKKLQKQISGIVKNKQDRIVAEKEIQLKADKYLEVQTIKQSYGLQVYKKDNTKKNKKWISSKQKSVTQKCVPMTPKPRFYHGTSQYDQCYRQIQNNKNFMSPKAKKNIQSTPLSPGNNRSLQNKSKLSSSKKSSLSNKKQKKSKIKDSKHSTASRKYF